MGVSRARGAPCLARLCETWEHGQGSLPISQRSEIRNNTGSIKSVGSSPAHLIPLSGKGKSQDRNGLCMHQAWCSVTPSC